MLKNNYLIINRKPYEFTNYTLFGNTMILGGEAIEIAGVGEVTLGRNIYAALCCDEVRNVTLVENAERGQNVITLLWHNDAEYERFKNEIEALPGMELSVQNTKLNRYAEEIAKKLKDGIELKIINAVDDDKMVKCPECGMMNPKGSPYCMDCGAELD